MAYDQLRADLAEDGWHVPGGRWGFWLRLGRALLTGRGSKGLMCLLRTRGYVRGRGWMRAGNWLGLLMERRYGCYISPSARIAPGVKFPHPVGIVIGEGVVVGARAVIYQHVTLGGGRRGDGGSDRYPVLGDDVTVFAGAAVVGKVNVGARTTIGANAVVLRDLPEACTAAGVPARVLRRSCTS
ncbi:serine acetyltransferase [Ideonella azotifigens]|uniref:serine O-acetyltransferase n=1 Tax=Ideonella azotifigens TaxID=513160 RepID=UPI001E4D1B37|nr:serine acetyltransferase [Ideonella azotifigens]MCD2342060.1 serine acetyltransferase [Ideonella azotifigens]